MDQQGKNGLAVSGPRGFWDIQSASTRKAHKCIQLCKKEHMIVCACVSVTHALEPFIIQAQAYCTESTGFTGRGMHAFCFSSQHSIWEQNGQLKRPTQFCFGRCPGDQGQEELGLNTRKLLPKDNAGLGAFRVVSATDTWHPTLSGSLLRTQPHTLPRLSGARIWKRPAEGRKDLCLH